MLLVSGLWGALLILDAATSRRAEILEIVVGVSLVLFSFFLFRACARIATLVGMIGPEGFAAL
jgi:hypothetical protein